MEDAFYLKLRARVERHLSKSPKSAIIHALLFTIVTVPLGLWGVFSHPVSVNGVIYWVIVLWSIVLFIHTRSLYLNSGASRGKREKYIEEEVLDAGETYDLDSDEMLALHLQLSDDIQKRSQNFKSPVLNALGNLILWPGMLVILLGLLAAGIITEYNFSSIFRPALVAAILGTFLLGFLLPVRQLWQNQMSTEDLRTTYSAKRKRKDLSELERAERLMEVGDDGEIILTDDDAKLKRL